MLWAPSIGHSHTSPRPAWCHSTSLFRSPKKSLNGPAPLYVNAPENVASVPSGLRTMTSHTPAVPGAVVAVIVSVLTTVTPVAGDRRDRHGGALQEVAARDRDRVQPPPREPWSGVIPQARDNPAKAVDTVRDGGKCPGAQAELAPAVIAPAAKPAVGRDGATRVAARRDCRHPGRQASHLEWCPAAESDITPAT